MTFAECLFVTLATRSAIGLAAGPKTGRKDHKWHAHVEIERTQYLDLRAWFSERAIRDTTDRLAKAFYDSPVVPYAPVRRQLLLMLRTVNRIRKTAGKKQLPFEVLPLKRRVVKPFAVGDASPSEISVA